MSWRVETAPPVIAKIHKPGKAKPDPLYGLFDGRDISPKGPSSGSPSRPLVIEYEPDPDLRDTEQIPFSEAPDSGRLGGLPSVASAKEGIEAFIRREVLPYTPDAWIKPDSAKVGYEISFTRHFYQPQPLRTLAEIRADILAVQQESEGLLDSILKGEQK